MKYTPIFLLFIIIGSYGVEAQNKVECSACVGLMQDFIQVLLNAILNGEVGGCEKLCSGIKNGPADLVCNLLCDYVGIKEFIKIVNETDPDPIYDCQQLGSCTHTDGGHVVINTTSVDPPSAPVGTTIAITLAYTVIDQTSAGYVLVDVNVPFNMPVSDGVLVDGQAPGVYAYKFTLDTTPNSNQDFPAGLYNVTLAVCAGDCSTVHPYGGTYAVAATTFTLTQS